MFKVGLIILGVFLVLSTCDVVKEDEHFHDKDEFQAEFGDEDSDGNQFSEGTEDDHIEVREQSAFVQPKTVAVNNGKDLPPLTFLYCVSCGYKQAFDQFSSVIREKYPNIKIDGGNYPPVAWKAYVAQAISFAKIFILAIIMFGSNPFANFGYGYPAILQHAHNNKMSTCMMVFMLSNLAEQTLISTGAFEIYLDAEQLWSKLESGRVPSPPELIQLIDAQLAILGKGQARVEGFGDFTPSA
ncbi:unnamed protein product [Caenorhabditis angaria]|uniref:SelT-like protein n=1 Tax=Caenorhabditis angaria TaxID=860376 RepID=A0A9P1J2M0_9PELO|nr:unnamed protein product [Caenorhabditis angaria]